MPLSPGAKAFWLVAFYECREGKLAHHQRKGNHQTHGAKGARQRRDGAAKGGGRQAGQQGQAATDFLATLTAGLQRRLPPPHRSGQKGCSVLTRRSVSIFGSRIEVDSRKIQSPHDLDASVCQRFRTGPKALVRLIDPAPMIQASGSFRCRKPRACRTRCRVSSATARALSRPSASTASRVAGSRRRSA